MGDLFDILIVGNGILAYSTAYALLQEDKNIRIGIIGPDNRLGGATVASGAMLGCFGEVTHTSLKSPAGRAKFEMAIASTGIWPSWLESMNAYLKPEQRLAITPGTFIILNAKSGAIEDENYTAIQKALTEYQQVYEEVKPNHIPGLEPIEDCRPLRAMYLPYEGSVDSNSVLSNLQNILEMEEPRIKLIKEIACKIDPKNMEYNVVLKNGEIYTASKVLVATGANSFGLIKHLPISASIPPLFSGVGFSLVIEQMVKAKITSVIRTPNRSFSCGLHVVPRGKNQLYIGATNNAFEQPKLRPNMGDIHFLLECALEQIHQGFEQAEIIGWNVGNRPMTIDTFPLIGETSNKGLWFLTGTYREGFHLSPLLAQNIAKQILGDQERLANNMFKPERLPISTMTKEDAIAETAKHYMALGYEFSIRMPQTGWQTMIHEMLTEKASKLYDALECNHFVLPPNLVNMIETNREKHIPYFREYYKRCSREMVSID